MNDTCPFCNPSQARATLLMSYDHWHLFLQSDEKRAETKQAAGFLAAKQHVVEPTAVSRDEWLEVQAVIKDAGLRLCQAAGVTYTGQETVGFNQGSDAGQTVAHAHVHILPVAEEDPDELKFRGGIGGAFEALRKERLGH